MPRPSGAHELRCLPAFGFSTTPLGCRPQRAARTGGGRREMLLASVRGHLLDGSLSRRARRRRPGASIVHLQQLEPRVGLLLQSINKCWVEWFGKWIGQRQSGWKIRRLPLQWFGKWLGRRWAPSWTFLPHAPSHLHYVGFLIEKSYIDLPLHNLKWTPSDRFNSRTLGALHATISQQWSSRYSSCNKYTSLVLLLLFLIR